MNLSTMQVDYTSDFLYAELNDEVYVDIPREFKQDSKVLKVKCSLYALRQSPRNFFLHLKNKLENLEFIQSEADSCLFVRPDMICFVYIDDYLFFASDSSNFESILTKLRDFNLS